jgi:hypothetical protein
LPCKSIAVLEAPIPEILSSPDQQQVAHMAFIRIRMSETHAGHGPKSCMEDVTRHYMFAKICEMVRKTVPF